MYETYRELKVWKLGREIVNDIYALSVLLPADERFGLAQQIKRAAVSIPSNIAEGYRRNNRTEYTHFLGIAAGSAAELETQLILINDLFEIDVSQALKKMTYLQKMLTSILSKLRPKP